MPVVETELKTKNDLLEIINKPNRKSFILKLGADWCGPCKKIEPLVHEFYKKCPENIDIFIIDVDESLELFGLFKTKRIINGIPALLGYFEDNDDIYPNEFVMGANENDIEQFFNHMYTTLWKYKNN